MAFQRQRDARYDVRRDEEAHDDVRHDDRRISFPYFVSVVRFLFLKYK